MKYDIIQIMSPNAVARHAEKHPIKYEKGVGRHTKKGKAQRENSRRTSARNGPSIFGFLPRDTNIEHMGVWSRQARRKGK